MSNILEGRPALKKEVEKIAEVAGYLWQNGWAERNGGTTGINSASVKAESNKDGVCYDLNGVAKKAPTKGINIRNGKKFVIK